MQKNVQSRTASAIIFVLLVGTTFALGENINQAVGWFGPGGGAGGGGAFTGGGAGPTSTTGLVVQVEELKPADWNVSAGPGVPPDSMFAPLRSLPVSLTRVAPKATLQALNAKPIVLSTDSAGLASFPVLNGSYLLQASTSTFTIDIPANVTKGAETLVSVKVYPTFGQVSSYVLTGLDASTSLEPSSVLYAETNSNLTAFLPLAVAPGQFVQLVVGRPDPSGLVFTDASYRLNASVMGSYAGKTGEWIALRLAPPPSALPTADLLIMKYTVAYTVNTKVG